MKTKSFPLLKLFLSAWLLAAFWGEGNAAVPSNWVPGSSYSAGDLVIYEGTTYIATQSISNSASPSTNTASWSSLDARAGSKSVPTGQPSDPPDTSSLSGLNVPADSSSSNGVVDRGSNWLESDWFGLYHKSGSNVFFHSTFGWIRINDASGGGIWIYQMNVNVWLYTNSEVYPKVYKQNTSKWEVPSAPVLRGGVPSAWSGSSVYSGGSLVIHGGVTHQALREVPAGIQPGSNSTYWQSLEQVAASLSTPAGQPTTTPDTSGISNLVVPNDSSSGSGNGSSTSGGVADVVPSIINFRGRLFDAQGQPKTGNVEVGVRIYDSASGDAAVFYENIGSVSVGNGLYSFQFGSRGSPDLSWVLKNHLQAWLEVSVDGAALSRQRLVSVPYALVAKSVGEGGVADVNGVLSLQPQSGTPTTVPGKVVLFAKPDGKLYYQDLNGTETVIGGGSGGGTPGAGAVTLDMLSPEVQARLADGNATASGGGGGTPSAGSVTLDMLSQDITSRLNLLGDENSTIGVPSTWGQKIWDRRFGTSLGENASQILALPDGGYLVVGQNASGSGGDQSEAARGSHDYWAVRLDASGNKVWDKRFGGSIADQCTSVAAAPDGGFLIAGYSNSGISGDRTEGGRGQADYWAVKIDADGNKQWDKRFGGSGNDLPTSVAVAADGGYVLAGYSDSGADGDRTEASRGSYDMWVVKIDAFGNKVWDKRFGGSGSEICHSIIGAPDGGFLLGGRSPSGVEGDKSEASRGSYDYWVVKINASGDKVWDKTFGGSDWDECESVVVARDGGFLLAGRSSSGVGGDRSETSRGGIDYWTVKIDSSGNKEWDKRFGGSGDDRIRASLASSGCGGFIVLGESTSGANGDKSEDSRGGKDFWAVKIAANGDKVWDRRFGGNGADEGYAIVASNDGGYLLAGRSTSGVDGDKSEPSRGGYDFWIVKIRDGSSHGGLNLPKCSITLDMLAPEVKAKLNSSSPAPLGATLANPYGWGGTPIIGEQEVYVVPDGKVLVLMSSDGLPVQIEDITANGTTKRFRESGSVPSIIPAGTKVFNQTSGWAGMLHEQLDGVTPVISRGENYTVPSGKVLVLTSSTGSITTPSAYGAKGFRHSTSWPSILPSGTQVISGNAAWGWSGYLKDN